MLAPNRRAAHSLAAGLRRTRARHRPTRLADARCADDACVGRTHVVQPAPGFHGVCCRHSRRSYLWERIVAESPAATFLVESVERREGGCPVVGSRASLWHSAGGDRGGGGEEAEVFAGWATPVRRTLSRIAAGCRHRRILHELARCESLLPCESPARPRPGADTGRTRAAASTGRDRRRREGRAATRPAWYDEVFAAVDAEQEVLSATRWARAQLDGGLQVDRSGGSVARDCVAIRFAGCSRMSSFPPAGVRARRAGPCRSPLRPAAR